MFHKFNTATTRCTTHSTPYLLPANLNYLPTARLTLALSYDFQPDSALSHYTVPATQAMTTPSHCPTQAILNHSWELPALGETSSVPFENFQSSPTESSSPSIVPLD